MMPSGTITEQVRAEFVERRRCIACQSADLAILASGRFCDEPVRGYIERDPWGVSPLPFLADHPWEFVQCRSCHQMFHKWLLTPEWQEIRFEQWMSEEAIQRFEREHGGDTPEAGFEKGVANTQHALRIEYLTRSIRGGDRVRLLDFGCGWGDFLTVASQFGFTAIGIDRSPSRQRMLMDRGIPVCPDLATAREAAGQPFHAVTLFQVLEHIDEPTELLKSIYDVMAPQSVLVIEVPNCEDITGIDSQADYYNIHPLEHMNCFSPVALSKFADRAGFVPVIPPIAHVTTSAAKTAKGEAKRWLGRFVTSGTNQYFRRSK